MMQRTAEFSACNTYRYKLGRVWNPVKPPCLFVMLNPSTADHNIDDPTIRLCIGHAMRMGFGSLLVGNIFAMRSTDPKHLWKEDDPIGPLNNRALQDMISEAGRVVIAWSADGNHKYGSCKANKRGGRADEVMELIGEENAYALRLCKNGQPHHPLYLPGGLNPLPYRTLLAALQDE